MADEIRRNRWSQFFKKFSAGNQYRQSTVVVERSSSDKSVVMENVPFLGVAILKKGRLIDGVNLFTGRFEPEKVSEPVLSVRQPVKVEFENEADGSCHWLAIHCEDGTVARVVLSGEQDPDRFHRLVEKVAYRIAEDRGFAPGGHVDDWLEAEKRIKATELELV